ncbi:dihydrofolate reductase family protein [Aquibium sp. A9E412]|uniref:dihydrofolate reductase family protein n=1 Tax=Aquibium sp. A9E412 TaxID=2976767 RepID=UPI0025B25BCF|nr:dihydrofolate reductase family protein [Aquibium sp. A9E412]MDN2566230.1 dihydrofolate reductase family protein [Aquibium sp. A9E412]
MSAVTETAGPTRYVGYVAMSLDGRIADAAGGLDWLMSGGGMSQEQQADYDAFYASVDALILGRTTYDVVAGGHEWPYAGKQAYVVTRRALDAGRDDVTAVAPDYAALRARIAAAGHRTVWVVGGGIVQRSAMDAGMFDHLRVFVIPVVVGSGPLIFADGPLRRLALETSRNWAGGVVELAYSIGETA